MTTAIEFTEQANFINRVDERAKELRDGAEATRAEYVDPRPGKKGTDEEVYDCAKCAGKGYIPIYSFNAGGECFDCHGAGTFTRLVRNIRSQERRLVNKANKDADRIIRDAEKLALDDVLREYADLVYSERRHAKHVDACTTRDELEEAFTKGDKINESATITDSYSFDRESYNGFDMERCAVIVFTLSNGTELVWYSTGNSAFGLLDEEKDTIGELTATVKKVQLRDRDGSARVVVTRVKFKKEK